MPNWHTGKFANKEVLMSLNGAASIKILFPKQSEISERFKTFDWSATSLGPAEDWPQSLCMAVGLCLNSPFPMFLWWGPDLINIYNDAYISVLGRKHPNALGMSARVVWADIWPVISDEVDSVVRDGEAISHERRRFVMERNGYPEETYFTYSHSPIPDEQGRIAGLFQVCTDETAQVLAEREQERLTAQRQLALDAANMGWWHYDPVTKIATWDDRYKEMFGVTGHQRPNEEILARIHPEDLPGVWAAVEAALDPSDPQPYAVSYRIRLDDGSMRWIEAHGIATFEGEGADRSATSFVGTVADITERKQAEDQLRRNGDTFFRLIEQAPFGMYVVDAHFRLHQVNSGAQSVFSNVQPLIGRDFAEAIRIVWPEPLASEIIAIFRHTLETGEPYFAPSLTEKRGDVEVVELYEWQLHRVRLPNGQYGVVCYFFDATKLRQVEAALRESEERFRTLTSTIPQFIWTATADGRVDYLSDQWAEYIGLSPQRLYDWGWEQVVHPEDLPNTRCAWPHSIKTGEPLEIRHRFRHRTGAWRWQLVRGLPIRDKAGQAYKWVGTCTDIDEQERAQVEIEALNVRLQRAMTETHHRVKNNLQIISAMVDMQVMDAPNDSVPVEEFKRLGAQIATLAAIHDLLTQEAKEGGEVEGVGAKAILDKLLPLLQGAASSRTFAFRVDKDAGLTLRQGTSMALVANELVSNAVKHGQEGVEVTFDAEAGEARLIVSNGGPGFPLGFDPQTAAHTGLELVEHLTRWDLGGSTCYGRREGGGAQVTVTFPVEPAQE